MIIFWKYNYRVMGYAYFKMLLTAKSASKVLVWCSSKQQLWIPIFLASQCLGLSQGWGHRLTQSVVWGMHDFSSGSPRGRKALSQGADIRLKRPASGRGLSVLGAPPPTTAGPPCSCSPVSFSVLSSVSKVTSRGVPWLRDRQPPPIPVII